MGSGFSGDLDDGGREGAGGGRIDEVAAPAAARLVGVDGEAYLRVPGDGAAPAVLPVVVPAAVAVLLLVAVDEGFPGREAFHYNANAGRNALLTFAEVAPYLRAGGTGGVEAGDGLVMLLIPANRKALERGEADLQRGGVSQAEVLHKRPFSQRKLEKAAAEVGGQGVGAPGVGDHVGAIRRQADAAGGVRMDGNSLQGLLPTRTVRGARPAGDVQPELADAGGGVRVDLLAAPVDFLHFPLTEAGIVGLLAGNVVIGDFHRGGGEGGRGES